MGGLSKDSRVTGTMTSNGWLDMGNGRFVSGSLLTATDPGGGSTPTPPPPADPPGDTVTRYVTVTANVRSGPGTNYGIVGTAAQGTQVTGSYTSNGWLDMGSSRFISGTLLTTTPPGSQPAPPPAPAPGTVTGAMILAEVAKYNGVPYLWGGSTPAGFDCSGLTWYTFQQLGISLPRTAAQQRDATPWVNDPRPGDLIFFGYPAYHVGIYAGNGMMYDAGRPGIPTQYRAVFGGVSGYGRVG